MLRLLTANPSFAPALNIRMASDDLPSGDTPLITAVKAKASQLGHLE